MLLMECFWDGVESASALKDRSNEVSELDRSAKSRNGAPVDSDSFSCRQHLRLVRGRPNPMAAALSKAKARAEHNALTGFESSECFIEKIRDRERRETQSK
jgi:hypothetical protein